MQELLSRKTIRLLRICEYIVLNNEELAIAKIMKLNDCSLKTAYNDVNELKDLWGDLLDISLDAATIFFKNSSVADIITVKHDLYQQEVPLQVLVHILLNPGTSLTQISEQVGYSESYIRKTITILNHYCSKFNITIKNDSNAHYEFVAKDERQLRYIFSSVLFIMYNIQDLLALRTQYLDIKLETLINNQIESLLSDFGHVCTPALLHQIKIYFYVSILRFEQGFRYDDQSDNGIADASASFKSYWEDDQSAILEAYVRSAPVLKIFNGMKLNLNEDSINRVMSLYKLIGIRIRHYPYRIDTFLNRYDIFYARLLSENPYIEQLIDHQLKGLKTITDIPLQEFTSELIFHLYNNVLELRNYKRQRIIVHSDCGLDHARSIALVMEKHFKHHECTVLSTTTIFESLPTFGNDYDLCVSTTRRMESFVLKHGVRRFVAVSDFLLSYDIAAIYDAIYKPD